LHSSTQGKPTLESLPALRAAELDSAGWLEAGSRNDLITDGLIASVAATQDGLHVIALTTAGRPTTHSLALHRLPAFSGAYRVLLGCPGCGERRAALYWLRDLFRCRRCLRLPYRSQQQSGPTRRRLRVDELLCRSATERTPALFAKPAGIRSAAWRRVLHDFAKQVAEEASRA
jgi:hypothetical protein